MSQISVKNIKLATIQMVGNKTRGEGLSAALTLADVSGSSDFLTKLIEKSFTMDDLKCFSYIESVEQNPVYQFASKIFDDNEAFLKQSVNMATYLYDQSVHPNIRIGELYVLLLECEYKKNAVEAIAILKSEKKDPFLATDNDGREISVRTIYGTGMKGLDKGCLILNVDRANGYVVGTVDNTNNGSDAQYWTDSFLHVTDCDDDYHQTVKLMDMCKAFEKQNGGFADEVNVVKKAAIRKPVTKMTTLKLGADFEVKVLNPEAKIEGGVDKKSGKKFYTLYYEG